MDFKLQEITLPAFLWYILPGLNFVLAVIAVPVLLLDPALLLQLGSLGGAVLVVLLALVAGFVMDSLELYALRSGHALKKRAFFEHLGRELGMSGDHARTLIDAVRMGLPERGALGRAVAFNHSRWVMMSHSAKCFYMLAIVWFFIAIVMHAQDKAPWYVTLFGLQAEWWAVFDIGLVVIAALVARKIDRHAIDQRRTCDDLYHAYARRYSRELRAELLGADRPAGELDVQALVTALRTAAELKAVRRQGWQEHGIEDGESVADHTFMVCLLAYLLAPHAGVDRNRCVALALLHDLPEAIVGDVTPNDPRRASKRELEARAARELSTALAAPEVHELWDEIERGTSAEARFVRELDKLEPAFQAAIYEGAQGLDLGEFYATARRNVESDLGNRLLDAILDTRAKAR